MKVIARDTLDALMSDDRTEALKKCGYTDADIRDGESLYDALRDALPLVDLKAVKWAVADDALEIKKPLFGGNHGDFVAVRPCGEGLGKKSFLGILIGDAPRGMSVGFDSAAMTCTLCAYHNPCILIPELNKLVYGDSCWWSRLKSPEDLKAITDTDIDNVWYVQALKALTAPREAASEPAQVCEPG